MDSDKLQSIYNGIVGKNQEHIILDYNAPFDISEYENIFTLNETLENISDCGVDDDILNALFKVNPDREEIFGMVLEEEGYNNLFSQPIPEEMIDYVDFSQIYICLSVNDG